jgi:hypothetical protein
VTKPARTVVVALSDTHGGSRLGLMPPDVLLLDDTGPEPRTWTPAQTSVQRWLWDCYVQDMAAVVELAGRAPIVLIHGGDATQGNRYPEACVSTRVSDQLAIALANIEQWYRLKNLRSVVLAHGTGSHEFQEGSAPTVLAAELGKRYKKPRTVTTKHGLLDVDGAKLDVAHHGAGPGGRAWLTGNELRYYAKSQMLDEITRGGVPPAAVIRGHYHHGVHETVRVGGYTTEAFVLPAYCGMTHYATQVTRSAYLLSCGLVALVIEGGRVVGVHELWRTLDLRQEEVV